ncbi:MAG: hypothetical protein AAFY60_17015, partial [Myxococcota bacterium]
MTDRLGGTPNAGAAVADPIPGVSLPDAVPVPDSNQSALAFDLTDGVADSGDFASLVELNQASSVLEVPVAGPPSPEFVELFVNSAELAQLAGLNPVSKVVFIWEESGLQNAGALTGAMSQNGTSAAAPGASISQTARDILMGTNSRNAMTAALGMNAALAQQILEDPALRGRIPLENLEAVTQSIAGLPSEYLARAASMSEDDRRIALLHHMSNAAGHAAGNREESYQLPDGWTIAEDGAIVRVGEQRSPTARPVVDPAADGDPVQTPADGADIQRPVRGEPGSAEQTGAERVDRLLGEIEMNQPAFMGLDTDGEWFRENFFPVLDLLNRTETERAEQGTLQERAESGDLS